jgi:hypothetical protein
MLRDPFAMKPASPHLTFAIICDKSPVDRCNSVQVAWRLDLHKLAHSCTSWHGPPLPGQIRIPSLAPISTNHFTKTTRSLCQIVRSRSASRNPDSPVAMTGGFYAAASVYHDEPRVAEAFRTGAGLACQEHHNCARGER